MKEDNVSPFDFERNLSVSIRHRRRLVIYSRRTMTIGLLASIIVIGEKLILGNLVKKLRYHKEIIDIPLSLHDVEVKVTKFDHVKRIIELTSEKDISLEIIFSKETFKNPFGCFYWG